MDAGGLYKLGTMTNSEQNVIFVYIYLDGGLRVGWFCTLIIMDKKIMCNFG